MINKKNDYAVNLPIFFGTNFKSALHHTSSRLGEVVSSTSVFGLFLAPASLLKSTIPAHVRAWYFRFFITPRVKRNVMQGTFVEKIAYWFTLRKELIHFSQGCKARSVGLPSPAYYYLSTSSGPGHLHLMYKAGNNLTVTFSQQAVYYSMYSLYAWCR